MLKLTVSRYMWTNCTKKVFINILIIHILYIY